MEIEDDDIDDKSSDIVWTQPNRTTVKSERGGRCKHLFLIVMDCLSY